MQQVMSHTHPYNLRSLKRKGNEELEFEHQFPHQLSREIMELIFNLLNDWRYRIRFSAVCKSWRWVSQQCTQPQPLWMMLSTNISEGGTIDFYSFSDGGVTHTIHIPKARGLRCCGSSHGWLIMQEYDDKEFLKKLILLNPLSKATISLPVKTKVGHAHQIFQMKRIHKAILSSAPDHRYKDDVDYINSDCLVAAIDIGGLLYLCRTRDSSWTKQHNIKYKNFRYKDVLFHERSLYGIERVLDQYIELEFSPDLNFKAKRSSFPIRCMLSNHRSYTRYLAECCGKVVLVFGVFQGSSFEEIRYRVCELKLRDCDGGYVESFDDGVLLLDHSSCRYFPINGCNGMNLQGNCIYFTGSYEFGYHIVYSKNYGTRVFELDERRFRDKTSRRTAQKYCPYVWYTPNIHI